LAVELAEFCKGKPRTDELEIEIAKFVKNFINELNSD